MSVLPWAALGEQLKSMEASEAWPFAKLAPWWLLARRTSLLLEANQIPGGLGWLGCRRARQREDGGEESSSRIECSYLSLVHVRRTGLTMRGVAAKS